MNRPKISVIVPVYNAEKFLHCCIDSILTQTFNDYELLLINDGSNDDSGAICDEYAAKDLRIRVFHKENCGVSSARNLGLDNANGVWVTFVDADDYVKDGYLRDLYEEAIKKCVDFVIQDFQFEKENGNVIERWYKPLSKKYHSVELSNMIIEQSLESRGYSFAKLFKMDIVKNNNIKYPLNVRFGEDACFVFRYLMYVTSVSCSTVANYCYIDHPGSAIHRKHDFNTEFNGYTHIKNAVLTLGEKYGIQNDLRETVLPWVTHFMHRAITVTKYKAELFSIPDDDWCFFNNYFKVITQKTAIDKWMITHFYKWPTILLSYLKFNVWLRNTIIKHNMYKILNMLKK